MTELLAKHGSFRRVIEAYWLGQLTAEQERTVEESTRKETIASYKPVSPSTNQEPFDGECAQCDCQECVEKTMELTALIDKMKPGLWPARARAERVHVERQKVLDEAIARQLRLNDRILPRWP